MLLSVYRGESYDDTLDNLICCFALNGNTLVGDDNLKEHFRSFIDNPVEYILYD